MIADTVTVNPCIGYSAGHLGYRGCARVLFGARD